ncbi:MAG: biotin transporter BioY [Saccharofermentanales bacterium]
MPEKVGRISLTIYPMALCSLFAALIAAGAFVRIPFPLVPVTLQTLFVILAALVLGAKYSAVSVGVYLFIGLAGFPVFTRGGGLGYVFQPTFGYLIGFLLAAAVVGYLAGKTPNEKHRTLYYWGIGLVGIIMIYLIGMIYMYFILNFYMKTPVGFISMITFNFVLTIFGDIFKCLVAAILASRLMPILEKSTRFQELRR